MVRNKPITITAEVTGEKQNGVIVAQGGSAHGYSLYMNDEELSFTVRRNGKITRVNAKRPAKSDSLKIEVHWSAEEIEIVINGVQSAKEQAPGLLNEMPVDGLQVGTDEGGLVDEYPIPVEFQGKIQSVDIRLLK